jgi:hypothetical protein
MSVRGSTGQVEAVESPHATGHKTLEFEGIKNEAGRNSFCLHVCNTYL